MTTTLSSVEVGAATRRRLLAEAERCFAARGIDGVSIRDITSAAGANTAAVHYHFGSKAGLVRAILVDRADEVGARRARWLERVESATDPSLRDVVEAIVVPTAEMTADEEHRHHIGFLAAVLAHPEHLPLVMDAFGPHTERFVAALERVTPHLSPGTRELRFALVKDMVNRAIGQPGGPVHAWVAERAPGADADLAGQLVDVLVGVFAAPES